MYTLSERRQALASEFLEVMSLDRGASVVPVECKHYTSNTEKWLRKFYMKTMATV